ncbi:MAG: 2-amino-4-hydroxy-6-hydroxymethyldihydropteridine diphosphokinase [Bacillota bacterium]|nr:2-amino-4-hydroxy-6-hydroxymethyldihydropteridine diphosphokinase [Bacillota bacterium]
MSNPTDKMPDHINPGKPVAVFLSLGSNLGDRIGYLVFAVHKLAGIDGIEIDAVSSLYETDPVGLTEQPAFYNCVVKIMTTLSPDELLQTCQAVERELGRERRIRWGPRTIDIDILTYGQLQLSDPHLILPHPRMQDRQFVMIPLRELTDGTIGTSAGVRLVRSEWYPTCHHMQNTLK